ncbi:MAG: cyclic pyranopterin monophosphate synthase MoaC [Bacteroidales bacterium]
MKKFSHTDNQGKARMVNVGGKKDQRRIARAEGKILLQPGTIELIRKNELEKGSVLMVAELAGVQAAKKTSDLIPLCHPLQLNHITVNAQLIEKGVKVESSAEYTGKTGVEMEALTAVNVALLTVYDMCKAVDKNMIITEVQLIEKQKEEK